MLLSYFNPGCALSIYKPGLEKTVFEYLKDNFPDIQLHKICCRHNPQISEGVIINVCAGCDRRFSTLYEGVDTITLWEVLDKLDGFAFPDYAGMEVSIHDACPIRGKPAVHQAVRSLLAKMNISVKEVPACKDKSICCGDTFYGKIPLDEVHRLMTKRAQSMPSDRVVVYCVSCIKSMHIGGKKPLYLVDLLFEEPTEVQEYRTEEWHEMLQEYIDVH